MAVLLILSGLHCGGNEEIAEQKAPEIIPEEYSFADINDVYMGELLYVPVYSSIYYFDDKKTMLLAATLSIHNTDLENKIKVRKINYYDSKGKILRRYLQEPRVLEPLETMNVVIEEQDKKGGAGANFIVEWVSDIEVSTPIVEAVMVSTAYHQGISFLTTGKIVKRFGKFGRPVDNGVTK